MRKIFPILLLATIVVAFWYFSPFSKRADNVTNQSAMQSGSSPKTGGNSSSHPTGPKTPGSTGLVHPDGSDDDIDIESSPEGKPAAEVYKSAEEAVDAVKKAALSYDDIVLEQFTEPGEECTWCDKFYPAIREMMLSTDATADQRSYYAELLAVSGKVDSVMALVDAIKSAPNQDSADIYAEALELAVGKDDVIKALSSELKTGNETLKEAVIGAITNQGSRLAVETLYKATVEGGDPDGFYSIGLGLGELVPEEDAYSFLQESVTKRDQYSHLAVKSLLNSGLPGVKIVFESLTGAKDSEFDRQMLKDARDHVIYDEETKTFLDTVVKSSRDPAAVEFAQQVLQDFKDEEADSPAGSTQNS